MTNPSFSQHRQNIPRVWDQAASNEGFLNDLPLLKQITKNKQIQETGFLPLWIQVPPKKIL